MIETFKQAVKYIESYIPTEEEKHPGKLGFERMKYLVKLLGDPHLKYSTIHIGGTSGKGSTATIIAYVLGQKYKMGLHTSPHLESICERIKILSKNKKQRAKSKDTRPYHLNSALAGAADKNSKRTEEDISRREFVKLLNEIIPAVKKMEKSKYGRPSYFEITTALAFMAFAKAKVDFAVIEVGMGGKYDATNVIKPAVVVLTNVGLEHTDVLGETVEEITGDKAGIIKRGTEVVSGVKQKSVIKVLESRIKNQESRLSLLHRDFDYDIKNVSGEGSVFDYFGNKIYRNLKLTLLGRHQVENASLAIRIIETLNQFSICNFQFSIKQIREGLKSTFIPGRLEIVKRNPLVVLDGAHNPDKMKTLVKAIKEIFPKKKVTAILAIKKGKDASKMFYCILPICEKVILTKFRLMTDIGETFSYEPDKLLKIIKSIDKDKQVVIIEDSSEAITYAINVDPVTSLRMSHVVCLPPSEESWPPLRFSLSPRRRFAACRLRGGFKADDLILVTGSLYLVGEVRRKIRNSNVEIQNKY